MTLEEAIKHCEEVAEELGMKADFETDNQTYAMSESERTEFKECAKDHRRLAEWLKELKAVHDAQGVLDTNAGDTISRANVIDTEGLDEQIRCEMCRNPMHTSRGCDGNCKYDVNLYKKIMQILGERIRPLPKPYKEEKND